MEKEQDVLIQLEKYELEKNSKKVYKLASELEIRRLNLLLQKELLKELREIKEMLRERTEIKL